MKITLDAGAVMPTYAHDHDAGLDLLIAKSRNIWIGKKNSPPSRGIGINTKLRFGHTAIEARGGNDHEHIA